MSLLTIMILGVGLAMDAFAVSVSKGLALRKVSGADMLKAGLWFGFFQGFMPALGYFFGDLITGPFEFLSSWIGFSILAFLGTAMIREGLKNEPDETDSSMKPSTMFLLSIATSIDALAVGVTFSMIPVQIVPSWPAAANTLLACTVIMVETGILSSLGIRIGELFGSKFSVKAQIVGGVLLILIGLRILTGH